MTVLGGGPLRFAGCLLAAGPGVSPLVAPGVATAKVSVVESLVVVDRADLLSVPIVSAPAQPMTFPRAVVSGSTVRVRAEEGDADPGVDVTGGTVTVGQAAVDLAALKDAARRRGPLDLAKW